MFERASACGLLLALLSVAPAAASQGSPAAPPSEADRELLERSDFALALPDSFRMRLEVTPLQSPQRAMEVQVWRSEEGTVVELLGERDRGKRFVQRGDALWFVAPGARAVRLSPSHRLAGGVSLQEILAPAYSRDYRIEGVRRDGIGEATLVTFELAGEAPGLAHPLARYVVRAATARPVRIELLVPSGRVARMVEFAAWAAEEGLEPRRLVVKDLLRGGQAVTVDVLELEPREVPPELFELPR